MATPPEMSVDLDVRVREHSPALANLRVPYASWCTLPLTLRCWLVFVHVIVFDVLRLGCIAILGNQHVHWGG